MKLINRPTSSFWNAVFALYLVVCRRLRTAGNYRSTSLPILKAFHTLTVVGNRAKKDEILKIIFMKWIDIDIEEPVKTGTYLVAALINRNTEFETMATIERLFTLGHGWTDLDGDNLTDPDIQYWMYFPDPPRNKKINF